MPEIKVQREGERVRFLPDGTGLVYMVGDTMAEQDFWLLDLGTMHSRRLSQSNNSAVMRTFDIAPDSKRIVFDRLTGDSDILIIDLAANQARPWSDRAVHWPVLRSLGLYGKRPCGRPTDMTCFGLGDFRYSDLEEAALGRYFVRSRATPVMDSMKGRDSDEF
jgi:hypothetical protein